MTLPLICPHDRHLLTEKQTGLICTACGRNYSKDSGIIRFLERDDEFYEGAYDNQVLFLPRSEHPWHIWPLWLITNGYPWTVRRFVTEGSLVVELGCAGGVRYFGTRYRMIGCDLSFSSLRKLDSVYEARLQADAAACLPLPNNSVDAVVSSYFWEHIPPDVKPHILKEVNRILRPDGKLIFLYDVETQNPLISHYRNKDQALYKSLFIEGDGHLGYQTPEENVAIFVSSGFRIIEHHGMEKTWLQAPSTYIKLAQFCPTKELLFACALRLGQKPFFYLYTAFLRFVDTMICKLLPDNRARIDIVVCEKDGP